MEFQHRSFNGKKDELSLRMQFDSKCLRKDSTRSLRANHRKVKSISHMLLCFQRLKSKSWGFIALRISNCKCTAKQCQPKIRQLGSNYNPEGIWEFTL